MADDFVEVSPDTTGLGPSIDTSSLTIGSEEVHRQRINIADPTTAVAIAAVKNTPAAVGDYGMVVRPTASDLMLAVPAGLLTGLGPLNKFGRNPQIDTTTDPEDIWDGGGVWAKPTQARIHNFASSNDEDGAGGATGMLTCRMYGLQDWDTAETSEDITLNGTNNVATVNSYVIIHRIEGLTWGSNLANVGNITATAVTDNTVTAQVSIGKNQTLMAVYGVPSTQVLYITRWYMAMNRNTSQTAAADLELQASLDPETANDGFLVKRHISMFSSGDSYIDDEFLPYLKIAGPAIIKIRCTEVSVSGTDVSAGFDGIVIDN
jgi:hypothetical protein